ncbi:hypothetical protein BDW59DRAFT_165355 [Aspergillus cavernicola]|uniref:Helix-turn-helix domain-containing protein n=1 Tax=Aspergillus cavernicola TaxID=176166 RepID=A0ABR4HUK6_9EURO
MGSSASKPARSAAQAASRRQYPKQPSTPSPAATRPPPAKAQAPAQTPREAVHPSQGPIYHSKEQASTEKSSAIDLDGRDPHFAASLRSLGPVTPSPTFSPSSTFNQHPGAPSGSGSRQTIFPTASNPALLTITARQRINKEADQEAEELGRDTFAGRSYLDALTVRQVLELRDRSGVGDGEIERVLRLKEGVVGRLGPVGVVGVP